MIVDFFVPLPTLLQSRLKWRAVGVHWNLAKDQPVDFFPVGVNETFDQAGRQTSDALTSKQQLISSNLNRFFSGDWSDENQVMDLLLAAATGSEFQLQVWRAIATIPVGVTRSYAAIAEQIGRPRATRAVGTACGKNPFPFLIPCHRVLASHDIGGYGYGVAAKRELLKRENVFI